MADSPQTMAQWLAYGATPDWAKVVINTLIANRPLLGEIPLAMWPGGSSFKWILNKSLPTITWEAETAAHYSTAAARYELETRLAYAHGDVQIPIHTSETMDNLLRMEAVEALDLVRAMGISLSGKALTGGYMTEANVTITGTGVSATPYVDAVTAVSANMPKGKADLKYTHTGTYLQFKAPGSTTWGAQVACAADGDYTVADGDDTTKSVTLTLDVSDLSADTTMNGALEFQQPEDVAGLKELAALDSSQVVTPSTNGDTLTLTMLDEIEEMCLGPKAEKRFLMNPRTRRKVKSLVAASGGMRQGEFQGLDLSKYDLNYEGVPVLADSNIAIDETQGSSSTCGRIYCVRLNREVGFHGFYGVHRGPNFGTMAAVSDHDSDGGPINLPVYMRRLGEMENAQYYRWRISAAMAFVLKRSTSCAMRYGITS